MLTLQLLIPPTRMRLDTFVHLASNTTHEFVIDTFVHVEVIAIHECVLDLFIHATFNTTYQRV